MSEKDEFRKLLEEYLDPPTEENPAYRQVRVRWIEGDPRVGALHMWEKHRVTKKEVEEVIFKIPPAVEARRDPDHPDRWLFFGATKKRRSLLIPCDEEWEGETRVLIPITAFDAEEGEWRKK